MENLLGFLEPYGNLETFFEYIVIILTAYIATRVTLFILKKIQEYYVSKGILKENRATVIFQILAYILIPTIVFVGLSVSGLDLTLIFAGSAALLVGVGLGLQRLFLDFVSGLILLLEGQIKIGDVVQLDKLTGRVRKVGPRVTSIITADSSIIIIPNSKFTSDVLVNHSDGGDANRYRITLPVPRTSDLAAIREVLITSALSHEHIQKTPAPEVFVTDITDANVLLELLVWSKKIFNIDRVLSEVRAEILRELKELPSAQDTETDEIEENADSEPR